MRSTDLRDIFVKAHTKKESRFCAQYEHLEKQKQATNSPQLQCVMLVEKQRKPNQTRPWCCTCRSPYRDFHQDPCSSRSTSALSQLSGGKGIRKETYQPRVRPATPEELRLSKNKLSLRKCPGSKGQFSDLLESLFSPLALIPTSFSTTGIQTDDRSAWNPFPAFLARKRETEQNSRVREIFLHLPLCAIES